MPTARRTLILALVFVAAGSLIFTTGAAVIDGPADTFAEDRLAIQPADGPNGQYAYLNDDDEIAIAVSASNPNIRDPSFEGVNVGTTGRIDDVFTITYTAERYAHVWIEYESENVTFVVDGDSIEGEANNVTLGPNQTVTVGLELDSHGAAAGTQLGAGEFSISAKIADPDEMTGMSASTQGTGDGGPTTTVRAPNATYREFVGSGIDRGESVRFLAEGMHLDGENVTLEGIDLKGVDNERVELDASGSPEPLENGGALDAPTRPRSMAYLGLEPAFAPDAVDAVTIRFSADPAHLDATDTDPEDVTLYRQTDAGAWEEVRVEVVDEEVVDILGLPADRVHFRATTETFSTVAVAERVPRFDATETTLETPAIDPGEEAAVRATVENAGGAAGEQTVTLTANGDPVANETVALAPNETATVTLSAAFDRAGEYDLAVAGTDAGSLLVGDSAADGSSTNNAVAGSEPEADTAEGSGGGPTEEPSAIDLVDLGGLIAFVALAVAGIALVRRMPRS
ncbi:CARDB domain-containing protein [Halorubrum sp. N11]|uniref:CARDB domain-containing protein n=1 Tax=Halorubrum sp. N11 TaxID=3402276 RepID=UPI003EBBC31B